MALEAALCTAGWGHAELGKFEEISGQSAPGSLWEHLCSLCRQWTASLEQTAGAASEGVPIGKDPGLRAGRHPVLVRFCQLRLHVDRQSRASRSACGALGELTAEGGIPCVAISLLLGQYVTAYKPSQVINDPIATWGVAGAGCSVPALCIVRGPMRSESLSPEPETLNTVVLSVLSTGPFITSQPIMTYRDLANDVSARVPGEASKVL